MVGADCREFLSEIFCRTVPKKFVEESFGVSLFPGRAKIYALERFVMIFCRIFYVSHYQKKLRLGTLQCFRIFPVSREISDKRSGWGGLSGILVRNFLSHSAEKICRGIL